MLKKLACLKFLFLFVMSYWLHTQICYLKVCIQIKIHVFHCHNQGFSKCWRIKTLNIHLCRLYFVYDITVYGWWKQRGGETYVTWRERYCIVPLKTRQATWYRVKQDTGLRKFRGCHIVYTSQYLNRVSLKIPHICSGFPFCNITKLMFPVVFVVIMKFSL
jgi:hypothetical protein